MSACMLICVLFCLLDGDNQVLRDHLVDELDYNLVPEEAWEKLSQWYGVLDEKQAIPRKVVEHGLYVKHCKVEVYLMELKLALNSQLDKVETRQFSKGDTLSKKILNKCSLTSNPLQNVYIQCIKPRL